MKQTILAAVLAITLGIASGFPLFTCDKLRDVDEEVDYNDQYLVKLKDSNNYKDAKHLIDLVKQYQTSLELYASNVHGSSVKSELELSENEGILLGTLSQQALTLVCLDSSVEVITPYYPKPVVLPEGSGEPQSIIDCPKFIPNESYSTSAISEYSIGFQPKTSTNNLYHIITSMTLASQNDDTIDFKYHHSIRIGRELLMLARMNIKAVEMICNEVKVKEIKVNHGTVSKRDATSGQEVSTSGPCDLPEHNDEFPSFIFVYKRGADLNAIAKSVEAYTENSAEVKLALPLHTLGMIIFQMNREAYLKACSNSEVQSAEYDQETTIAQQQQQQQHKIVVEQKTTDAPNICDQVDSLPDDHSIYRAVIKRPGTVKRKQRRCSQLIEELQNKATSDKNFWIRATDESCKTSGKEVTMTVRLNVKALKYTCGLKGLDISLVRPPPVTRLGFAS